MADEIRGKCEQISLTKNFANTIKRIVSRVGQSWVRVKV